jgi:tRNA(Arg) A34 adenosine deaminase TadA
VTEEELRHLRRCLELATEALEAGDEPFGSVLVAADGRVLAEDRNRVVSGGDRTRHPELELAATVFTSGEHRPMCAAAHGWVGLGRPAAGSAPPSWRSPRTPAGRSTPPTGTPSRWPASATPPSTWPTRRLA